MGFINKIKNDFLSQDVAWKQLYPKLLFLMLLLVGLNFFTKKIHVNLPHSKHTFLIIIALVIFFDFGRDGALFGILRFSKQSFISKVKNVFSTLEWVIVLGVSILLFLSAHSQNGNMGIDQFHYIDEARKLPFFALDAESYRYPFGYPLLAAPFFYMSQPYFIPNLIMFTLTIVLIVKIAEYFYINRAFTVLGLIFLCFYSPFVELMAYPWSSTVTTLCFYYLLYEAVKDTEVSYLNAIGIGLAVGFPFAARYVDILFILPLGIFLIVKLFKSVELNTKDKVKRLAVSFSFLFLLIGLVFLLNYKIFGSPTKTGYDVSIKTERSGYLPRKIPERIFANFYSPIAVDPGIEKRVSEDLRRPILAKALIFSFSIIGLFLSFYIIPKLSIALTLAIFIHFIIYGTHAAGAPGAIQYGNTHYFKVFFPLFTLFSMQALFYLKRMSFDKLSGKLFLAGVAMTFGFPLILWYVMGLLK